MNEDPAAIYNRAKRLGNLALWTVELQCRRLKSIEPEDSKFVLRRWSDFHFLIVALMRLRRAADLIRKWEVEEQEKRRSVEQDRGGLSGNVEAKQEVPTKISVALREYHTALPHLRAMRNVAEHIDDYAIGSKKNQHAINRKGLEVASLNGDALKWLDFELDAGKALSAAAKLYGVICIERDAVRKK